MQSRKGMEREPLLQHKSYLFVNHWENQIFTFIPFLLSYR